MKIAVTGGLGHIGSKLIRELPKFIDMEKIIILDNLMTQRYVSLFDLPKNCAFSFHEVDVITSDLKFLLKSADVVIHLAAITDATSSFSNKEQVEYVNYNATDKVSQACLENNIAMIHLSSTSVYGTQKDKVDEFCNEEDLKPQSPYAETKLGEEKLIQKKVKEEGLKALTFRFGTIFGTSPGMRFHTAVNKFCWQAAMGQKLTVWETAFHQKRPYLSLDDAVQAIALVIEKKLYDGNIYNVVTKNLTVKNIVDEIQKTIPSLSVDFVKKKIMNQLSYEVLNTRLSKKGFLPKGNFEKDIKGTIDLLNGIYSSEGS